MAINKKLIHFDSFSDFSSKKLSANKENTKYTLGVDGAVTNDSPDILWHSICWIKDKSKMWTHGKLYDCSSIEEALSLLESNKSKTGAYVTVGVTTKGGNVDSVSLDETKLSNALDSKASTSYVDRGLGTKADTTAIPTKVSQLTNDSGYITSDDLNFSGSAEDVVFNPSGTGLASTNVQDAIVEVKEAGVTDVTISVDNTSGIPSASAVIENQVLKIELSGLKGEQGNSGFQGDFSDFEVINNLADGGADKALSAEMGKELDGKVTELKKELVISPEYHTYSGKITDGVISSSDNIFYVWSGYYCMLINTSVLTSKIRISNIADKNITVCFIEGLPKHGDLVKYVGEKLSLAPSKSIELEVPVGAKSLYVNNGTTTEAMSKIELFYNEGEKIDFTLEDGFITGDNYYRKYDFPVKSAIVEVQHGDTYKITSAIETDISLLKERPVLDGDVVVYSDFAPSKFKSNDTIIAVPEDAKYMIIRAIDVDGTDKGVEIKKCSFESKQFIKELNEKIEQSLHFISSLDARQTTTETDVESVKAGLEDVSESVKKNIVSREVDKELSSIRGIIASDGTWFYPTYENYRCLMLPTYGIYKIRISTKDTGTRYAFVKKELGSINEVPQFAEGTKPISISANQDLIFDIPSEGKFLYVLLTDKSGTYIDGLDIEIMVMKGNYAKHEVYIAAENSSEIDKANADVICDGIHDEVEIQDAIDLMKKVCGKVILYQGDYYVDSIPEHVIDGKPQKVALCMLTEKSNEKYGVTIEGMTSGKSLRPVIHVNETAFANTTDEHAVFGGGCSEATNYLGGIGMIIRNIQCIVPFGYKCVVSNNQYFYWGMVENCSFSVEGYKERLTYTEGSVGLRGWNGFTDGTVVGAKDVYVSGFHVGFQMGGEHVICERLGARYDGIGYTFGEYDMNYHGTDPSLAIGQIHPITMINCCAEFTDDLIKFYGSGSAENKGAYRCEVSFISFNVELSSFTMGYDLSRGASEVVEGGWVGRIDYTVSNGTTTNYVDKQFWADGHGKNFRTTNLAQHQMGNTTLRNTFAPNYCQQYFDTDLQKIVYCVEPSTKTWVDATGAEV